MSQSTDSPVKKEHLNLDEESVEKLRQLREVMLQRFNDHTAGKMALPPEQSLSLRSNISKITEMIEPGTQAMWPECSSAESAYLAEQSTIHKRDANNLGIALLGPMASPAILAKELGAPTETVNDLLQIGFNIAGAKSLSGAGRTSNARGVIEPKVEPEIIPAKGQVHQEPHANLVESTPYSPQTATDNIMKNVRQAIPNAHEVRPILDWYQAGKESSVGKYDTGRLAMLMEQYSGKDAKIIAELGSSKSIDTLTKEFKQPEKMFEAFEHQHQVTMDFVDSISTQGSLDPAKLAETLSAIKHGNFLTATDFAALELARGKYHEHYVNSSAGQIVVTARISGITDQAVLDGIEAKAKTVAEKNSPYQLPKSSDHDLPPPNKGLEP
ncbi:MAG: hypothetical protein Q8N02_10065 [Methylotenera sp.]|nr:hypothetical protein [Methylotenera sp.]MDP2101540.1 hypothetical protein [Methylotenera sp.]MDP2280666.1 hypothetical protein [Methylotenera sp.]MDP2404244.1 hypothetical protein [Methylotenera sp.]MDP3060616.1 hypothetical protein [Methylotenera sp.]